MSNSSQELNEALMHFTLTSAARMQAIDATIDALIATLGKSLPPLLDVLEENLRGLSGHLQQDMDPAQLPAFQASIDNRLAVIRAVR